MSVAGSVAEIWRYPVKSMGGERLAQSAIAARGLHADRMWAVRGGSRKLPANGSPSVEGGRAGDVRGLLAITGDSANQLQTVRGVPAYGARAGP